jgi:ABC-2 type transport system permease protein
MINKTEPINWYGTYSLTKREISRFLKVYNQTVIAPAVSALIFLAIFVLALGGTKHRVGQVEFVYFMGCGLIIMSIVQNAFANSSSSLIMSKVIGYISDILMPPFGGPEIVIALCIGSIARGLTVGIVVWLSLAVFIDFTIYHPFLLVFFTLSSSLLLGLFGILAGIMSNSFDKNAAISSYVITPLSFLSGTFYSIEKLPSLLQHISYVNPFFYMIDGFRFSLTNQADSNIIVGAIYLSITNIFLFTILIILVDKGWRIKD